MFDRVRENISWEKKHIEDVNGNEYDIWIFYEHSKLGKKQILVCHTEEEFRDTRKYYCSK